MKLSYIKIRNILGIEELEIEPGKINIISGQNATGKTSVFEAIKTALQGGNDATLIKNSSEEGEIVLLFDNNYQVKRSIFPGKTAKVKYTDGNGINIPSPQSELNLLFDKIAVNPVEFMHQKGKERTETLLSALNIKVPVEDIKSKLNGSAEKVKFQETLDGLPLIDNIIEQIFTERTVVNRLLKNTQSYAVELSETLSKMDKTDVTELEKDYNKLNEQKQNIRERAHQDEMVELKKYNTAIQEQEAEMNEAIAFLKQQFSESKDKLNRERETTVAKIHEEETKAVEKILVEITELKTKIDNAQIVKSTKDNLEKAQKQLREYQSKSESMTNELDTLKEMKTSITDELPIKGLSIKEGEIYVDEIPYERLNTAKKLEIALEVAKLRAGKLKLICVDGLEVFDSTTLQTFKELASKTEHQYIMTKVTDDRELTITAE